jgi:DMSO/TMAO reductase YedYZ molybdopterin-dependent catalytic subunit
MNGDGPFFVRSTRIILLDLIDRAVQRGAHRLEQPGVSDLDRRAFLRTIARSSVSTLAIAYGVSLMAACGSSGPDSAQRLVRAAGRRNELVERWLFRHTSMDFARASWATAGTNFPSYHVAPAVPMWDAASLGPWGLLVTGRVAHPLRFSLTDLARLPHISQRVEHFCVEGWNAVATWTGVRVSDLAVLAGADPSARYVDFRSFDVEHPDAPVDDAKTNPATATAQADSTDAATADSTGSATESDSDTPEGAPSLADLQARRDYHECWDIESAMHPQTIVAFGMDGYWLGPDHGAPARLHSPVKLGYKNTKYLTQIIFQTERGGGYWSDEGYEWYGGT